MELSDGKATYVVLTPQAGKVVNLADWSDGDRLAPHEPEATDIFTVLGFKHCAIFGSKTRSDGLSA